jgi:hypothetical protein
MGGLFSILILNSEKLLACVIHAPACWWCPRSFDCACDTTVCQKMAFHSVIRSTTTCSSSWCGACRWWTVSLLLVVVSSFFFLLFSLFQLSTCLSFFLFVFQFLSLCFLLLIFVLGLFRKGFLYFQFNP